jgi:hypothetical protein
MTELNPGLNTNQKEVLRQLFMNGPTWDGDIVSKAHRDDLASLGLAYRGPGGFTNITNRGMQVALGYGFGDLKIQRKQV